MPTRAKTKRFAVGKKKGNGKTAHYSTRATERERVS